MVVRPLVRRGPKRRGPGATCAAARRRLACAAEQAVQAEQLDVVAGRPALGQVGHDLADQLANLNPCPEHGDANDTCG